MQLARDELAIRPDVYGYDTLAWALLNAGDAAGADAPMQSALAAGTQDARLWYHAGLIALANGRPDEAATDLRERACPRAGPGPVVPRAGDRRPGDDPMRRPSAPRSRGPSWRSSSSPVVAAVALAHPLGNFTINHYAGIRVEPSRVLLDVVIDEAEIPTFQATPGFDLDGDGTLSAAELGGGAASTAACRSAGRCA